MVRVIYSVFKPINQSITFVQQRGDRLFNSYIWLVEASKKNRELTEEVRRLRTEILDLKEKELENKRLKRILKLKSKLDFPTVAAQIIGQDASGLFKTVLINKGSEDGVLPDMGVVVPDGIVGKINRSSGSMAQVTMITDPGMSVDCRVERTRDRGLLSGSYSYSCLLQYVNKEAQIREGDIVVTSGLDGIFPRGLVVGRVQSVRLSEHGLFKESAVMPSAKLSEIEEVVVMLGTHGAFSVESGLENKR